ncbi:unnamed protein product [Rotaria socialis]
MIKSNPLSSLCCTLYFLHFLFSMIVSYSLFIIHMYKIQTFRLTYFPLDFFHIKYVLAFFSLYVFVFRADIVILNQHLNK